MLHKEAIMKREKYILNIMTVTLLAFILAACSSTSGKVPVTPDASVVWSDDFEDGDADGWTSFWVGGEHPVKNGELTFAEGGGDVAHPSDVLYGTWSFDIYISEPAEISHEVRFTEGVYNYQLLEIRHAPNTQVWVSTQQDPNEPRTDSVDLGEQLSGWHHFDITKDQSGLIQVYLDGEWILDHEDDLPFEVREMTFYTCCEGPALDNVVVRDQVIEVQLAE
jgi:hypothetical protein